MPAAKSTTDFDFVTIVSGLPRSGTSLMMQMLAAGGLPALTDALRAPDESNPRGYFEFDPVKRLRSDREWLEQARGRAVKIIHLLLKELPVDGRFQYRVVFLRRSIAEILTSQRAMLEREGKTAADDTVLAKVYRTQVEQAEQWLASQPAFSVLYLDHRDLIQSPAGPVSQLNEFLGGELDVAAMIHAIDPALYRQRA